MARWCTTQELAAFVTIARGTATTPGLPAPAPNQIGMPPMDQCTRHPVATVPETICDSDSDLSDDKLEAALALACPAVARAPEDVAHAQIVAVAATPEDLPVMDPRATGGLRLAAFLAREPCTAWEDKVRHLRDSFQLPPRLVLALVLIDPGTLSYIFDSRSIFEVNHCPAHGARHWYALVDMVNPLAGEMAFAMMSSESLRGTALSLIAL